MYSHRFIRENLDLLKGKLSLRGVSEEFIDEVYRNICSLNGLEEEERSLNEERNRLSSDRSPENFGRIKEIKEKVSLIREKMVKLEGVVRDGIDSLPNLPDDSLEGDYRVVKEWGERRQGEYENHKDICKRLNLVNFEEGVSISGSGFAVYVGKGAALYRALVDFTLQSNIQKGYEERHLPVLLLPESLYGTAQLPKFEHDLFATKDGRYLSPTSESQLVNIYRNKIIEGGRLPIKLTANTNCFRKEAGSHGVEDSGIIRLHQFSKTEIVVFCSEEESYRMLDHMVIDACDILEKLELPYRVLQLAYDDMGFASAKTFDIEVWFPSEGRYREISSLSNTLAFQSRRAKIRCKKNLLDTREKAFYPHILNGSSLAIDRLFAAVVDNYQTRDGAVMIPRVLVDRLGLSMLSD